MTKLLLSFALASSLAPAPAAAAPVFGDIVTKEDLTKRGIKYEICDREGRKKRLTGEIPMNGPCCGAPSARYRRPDPATWANPTYDLDDPTMNTDPDACYMMQGHADEYCAMIGQRLPSAREFLEQFPSTIEIKESAVPDLSTYESHEPLKEENKRYAALGFQGAYVGDQILDPSTLRVKYGKASFFYFKITGYRPPEGRIGKSYFNTRTWNPEVGGINFHWDGSKGDIFADSDFGAPFMAVRCVRDQ